MAKVKISDLLVRIEELEDIQDSVLEQQDELIERLNFLEDWYANVTGKCVASRVSLLGMVTTFTPATYSMSGSYGATTIFDGEKKDKE